MKNINMVAVMNKKNNVMGIYENEVPANVKEKANRYGWTEKRWTREVYESNEEKAEDMKKWADNERKAWTDAYDNNGY